MLFRANYELLQSRYGCWLVQFTNDSILPIKKKKYLHKNITQYTNISEKKTVTALKHAKEKITKMKNNWKGFFGVLLKKNIWTYSRGNDEKKKNERRSAKYVGEGKYCFERRLWSIQRSVICFPDYYFCFINFHTVTFKETNFCENREQVEEEKSIKIWIVVKKKDVKSGDKENSRRCAQFQFTHSKCLQIIRMKNVAISEFFEYQKFSNKEIFKIHNFCKPLY